MRLRFGYSDDEWPCDHRVVRIIKLSGPDAHNRYHYDLLWWRDGRAMGQSFFTQLDATELSRRAKEME